MPPTQTESQISEQLLGFVREELLTEGQDEFEAHTPLLASGLIDSVRSARLLRFIKDELMLDLPLEKVTPENLHDVRSLAAALVPTSGNE